MASTLDSPLTIGTPGTGRILSPRDILSPGLTSVQPLATVESQDPLPELDTPYPTKNDLVLPDLSSAHDSFDNGHVLTPAIPDDDLDMKRKQEETDETLVISGSFDSDLDDGESSLLRPNVFGKGHVLTPVIPDDDVELMRRRERDDGVVTPGSFDNDLSASLRSNLVSPVSSAIDDEGYFEAPEPDKPATSQGSEADSKPESPLGSIEEEEEGDDPDPIDEGYFGSDLDDLEEEIKSAIKSERRLRQKAQIAMLRDKRYQTLKAQVDGDKDMSLSDRMDAEDMGLLDGPSAQASDSLEDDSDDFDAPLGAGEWYRSNVTSPAASPPLSPLLAPEPGDCEATWDIPTVSADYIAPVPTESDLRPFKTHSAQTVADAILGADYSLDPEDTSVEQLREAVVQKLASRPGDLATPEYKDAASQLEADIARSGTTSEDAIAVGILLEATSMVAQDEVVLQESVPQRPTYVLVYDSTADDVPKLTTWYADDVPVSFAVSC